MKRFLIALALVCGALHAEEGVTPDEALQRLLEGNQRYVDDKPTHPLRNEEARTAVANIQRPFATILGCSDSRVPPEIIFDQGIGDVFTVRVAGNVAGPVELDSLEYSGALLNSPLILVLGHEQCGAIKAVMTGQTKDLEAIAALISPCIEKSYSVEEAVKFNVGVVVHQLKGSPVLAALIKDNKLKIMGGYYHFASGKVDILPIDTDR